MTEMFARWLSGDIWSLGVCTSMDEVQVRASHRTKDKLAPDVMVLNEQYVPLVGNSTDPEFASLPPLVVVIIKENAREDPDYYKKAVQMHAEAED